MMGILKWVICIVSLLLPIGAAADQSQEMSVMNNQKLEQLIKRFDENAQGRLGYWQVSYENVKALVVTDENADRMRILVQITDAEQLEKEHLYRAMQANFDSALDARYAVAQGKLWSTFIHPLGALSDEEFFSGMAQTIVLALTFGSTYSSGALIFNGGDSREEQQKLYQKLLQKGHST